MESSVKDLSKYRFENSLENLEDARIMFENGRYDSSKHSGVIAYFNQNYVKTNIFPKELSKIIRYASESREKADYLDFYVASKEEAEKQIARAENFSEYIRKYLSERDII